ncbi:MAG: hypothetical protein HY907_02565 [Deltaproteobacteria bacterium]|nr:hypothetical protein [Deltaproteobacteria bacterium]
MSMKRWMGLAVVLAVAAVGCKKKESEPAAPPEPVAPVEEQPAPPPAQPTPAATETGPAQPAAGAAGETAAPAPQAVASADDSKAVLEALDESFGRMGKGLGGAMGGLMMAPGGAHDALEPGVAPPAPGTGDEDDAPPPIQRFQFHLDVGALRASALGGLVDMGLAMLQASGDVEENKACIFALLGKVNSAFADVTLGADGEPSSFVVSIKSTATKDEVVECMRTAAEEGEEFVEVPVGDRTGYTMKTGDEPIEAVLVEATPGNWLLGMPESVQAGLGADPEADATFQALVAPLGPSALRMTVLFKPEFAQLGQEIGADAPPQAACLRGVLEAAKGGSFGLRFAPEFSVTVALQNGTSAQAAETQACLTGLWAIAKPAILGMLGQAEAAQIEMLLGMSAAQLLDSVKIESAAEFAKVSVSLPGEVLSKLVEMIAQIAQMGAH